MPNCALCDCEKKLTGEHVIPAGLLRRLEDIDFLPSKNGKPVNLRPRTAWLRKVDKMYVEKNATLNDLCEVCQHALQKVFDDNVDLFFKTIREGLEHAVILNAAIEKKSGLPTLCIEVDEPWFTMYMLRIFWNTLRLHKELKDYEGLKQAINRFVFSNGGSSIVPRNIFVALTYLPPIKYGTSPNAKLSMFGMAYANPVILHDVIKVTRASMTLICYRLLIGEVDDEYANEKVVRNYFRNVTKKMNGVPSMVNNQGRQKYIFNAIDPTIGEKWGTPVDKIMTEGKLG